MRFLVVAFLLLVGCGDNSDRRQSKDESAKVLKQGKESDLVRYEDSELNMVCYRVRGFNGLSCSRKILPQLPN